MKVLYWLESIRAPWLDAVMLAISQLGGEILVHGHCDCAVLVHG